MIIIKKKIIFGITSLTLGGAERVLVDISNKLCDTYDVTIFSIYDNGELKKELNSDIHFKALYNCRYDELSSMKKMWSPIRILLFAKAIYKKYIKGDYDVEVSFLEGPITRLFSQKNNTSKKIVWVHNDIKYVFGNNFKSKLKKLIDKKIYKRYDDIVFVSKENMKSFQETYTDIDKSKMSVIYNYIDSDLVKKKADEYTTELKDCKNIKFVTVCRLVEQKAIDRLIRVHKRIIDDGLMHEFFIIGDGPERSKLEQLIKENKVESTFHLLGKKENPYPYIKEADYFCLLSYFEGYGMVLEEAKILNKKIIITDTAAKEALEGYRGFVLIDNNDESIYNVLSQIINGATKIDSNVDISVESKSIKRIIELLDK